ncbi:MAG: AMP-binding protein, partial [Kordiimonadaceae bacterium]|nr:AMP-binding protein [Kordiimonadaceae bacterium]
MSENKIYPVKNNISANALINNEEYLAQYNKSISDPEAFWDDMAGRIDWIKPYTQVKDVSFAKEDLHIKWYHDGTLNACVNCVDRHLESRGDQTAIIFEGDDPTVSRNITYRELYEEVCRFANVLKSRGAKKGDRITLYMPMIPEAVYAMLACARIGAIHSIVFGGFSPDALAGRLIDCDSHIVITADEGVRGAKPIPLKNNVDKALENPDTIVETVIVVKATGADVGF